MEEKEPGRRRGGERKNTGVPIRASRSRPWRCCRASPPCFCSTRGSRRSCRRRDEWGGGRRSDREYKQRGVHLDGETYFNIFSLMTRSLYILLCLSTPRCACFTSRASFSSRCPRVWYRYLWRRHMWRRTGAFPGRGAGEARRGRPDVFLDVADERQCRVRCRMSPGSGRLLQPKQTPTRTPPQQQPPLGPHSRPRILETRGSGSTKRTLGRVMGRKRLACTKIVTTCAKSLPS